MKIALDTFGGDNAPEATIEGARLALCEADQLAQADFKIVLVGNKASIKPLLNQNNDKQFEIVDTLLLKESTENDPHAIGENQDSAIRTALRRHHNGEFDAVVSAGSTGAQVVASLLELEKCPGITRPAVGSRLPTNKGYCFLIDVGASLVATPHHLVQFATMGHVYTHEVLGIKNPRIGVLNVGQESLIGDRAAVEAHSLLSESKLNYVGFVEGRDIPNGAADVIVTNGFIGNVLLKYTEGLPVMLQKFLSMESYPEIINAIKKRFDYESYGGEPLLGIKGVSIICHGASSKRAIASAIMKAVRIAEIKLHDKIEAFLIDRFDSYLSQVKYLRSFRRSLRASWRGTKKDTE